ncbi:hypothetical protein JCM21900_006719 [Sporobolomyces salmonicolor]
MLALQATLLVSLLSSAYALPTPQASTTPSVFRAMPARLNAAPPNLYVAAMPAEAAHPSSSDQVAFDACPAPAGGSSPAGVVHNITVTPCTRSSPSEPCHFHYGHNYTIEIEYTSYLQAEQPRSTLLARDDSTDPSQSYPYSGQTFDACAYTQCPVPSSQPSLYTYTLNTLLSPFDYLQFNVTQDFDGPSLFCAGFDAKYVDDKDPKRSDAGSNSNSNSSSATTTSAAGDAKETGSAKDKAKNPKQNEGEAAMQMGPGGESV